MTIATLLPNAKQSFTNGNGTPLAGGKVYFYVPGSTTPKNTWQNSSATILNTNPIILDAAGRAIIYGTGAYRQIVVDANGNTIWDQITTDLTQILQSSVSIWCGQSTGSANSQVLTPESPITSYVTGQGFTFQAGFTNTSAMQVNISDVGLVNVTQSGAALASGVIQENSINLILYDGTSMQLLATSYLVNISPTGTIIQFAATTPPAGFLECNGDAISRSTYANLFAIIGTTFGAGDTTTTFNLPDMRGYFPRGWDNGAGRDPARAFGSSQQDQFQTHAHSITDPTHTHTPAGGTHGTSFLAGFGTDQQGFALSGAPALGLFATTAASATGITVGNPSTGSSGTETRAKNVAILFAIKT